MKEAFRKPYFYTMSVCVFLAGTALQGVHGISAAHLSDVGLSAAFVSMVVSLHSIALSCTKFFTGPASDKIGLRKMLLFCDISGGLAFLLLGLATADAAGQALGIGYAIFSALGIPLETVIISLITAELFGQRGFNKMLGIFSAINTAGFAIGAPIANLLYDLLGTYQPFLFALVGIMLVVTVLSQYSQHLSKKDQQQAIEA